MACACRGARLQSPRGNKLDSMGQGPGLCTQPAQQLTLGFQRTGPGAEQGFGQGKGFQGPAREKSWKVGGGAGWGWGLLARSRTWLQESGDLGKVGLARNGAGRSPAEIPLKPAFGGGHPGSAAPSRPQLTYFGAEAALGRAEWGERQGEREQREQRAATS